MPVPSVLTIVTGNQTAAAWQSGIEDVLRWLMTDAQIVVQRSSSVALTQGLFTTVDSITASDAGHVLAFGSVRCSSVRGNKELRLTVNEQYDDADPWIATQNQFGVATPAFSSLAASGVAEVAAGDTIDLGVFVDTPDSCQVDNGVLAVVWIRN